MLEVLRIALVCGSCSVLPMGLYLHARVRYTDVVNPARHGIRKHSRKKCTFSFPADRATCADTCSKYGPARQTTSRRCRTPLHFCHRDFRAESEPCECGRSLEQVLLTGASGLIASINEEYEVHRPAGLPEQRRAELVRRLLTGPRAGESLACAAQGGVGISSVRAAAS